jgi:hypothetical protein
MKTWTCDQGHQHGYARGNRGAKTGDPCKMRKATTGDAKTGELMGQARKRALPARIKRIVSGGLPGTGKRT